MYQIYATAVPYMRRKIDQVEARKSEQVRVCMIDRCLGPFAPNIH